MESTIFWYVYSGGLPNWIWMSNSHFLEFIVYTLLIDSFTRNCQKYEYVIFPLHVIVTIISTLVRFFSRWRPKWDSLDVGLSKHMAKFSSKSIKASTMVNISWTYLTFLFPNFFLNEWSLRSFSKIQHCKHSWAPSTSIETWVNSSIYNHIISFFLGKILVKATSVIGHRFRAVNYA